MSEPLESSTPPPNPYPRELRLCKIQAQISPEDFQFFRTLFPYSSGLIATVISTHFHHVCNELRKSTLSPVWCNLDPAFTVLREILERSTAGRTPLRDEWEGDSSPRDDRRGLGEVCATPQPPSAVVADIESDLGKGKCETRRETQRQTESSTPTPVPDKSTKDNEPGALKMLRDLNIL